MLKLNPSGKILPVRIFKPLIKNGFVTHAARVFQIMQRDHQANWTGGDDRYRAKACRQAVFKTLPINRIGKFYHRMVRGKQYHATRV